MSGKAEGRPQYAKAIFHAALEVDGRSFLEVFSRAGDFANTEVEHHGLRNHLIVEDEVVRVLKQGQRLQQFA